MYQYDIKSQDTVEVRPDFIVVNGLKIGTRSGLDGAGFRRLDISSSSTRKLARKLRTIAETMTASEGLVEDAGPRRQDERIAAVGLGIVSLRNSKGDAIFVGHFGSFVKALKINQERVTFVLDDGESFKFDSLAPIAKAVNREFGNVPRVSKKPEALYDNSLTIAGYSRYGIRAILADKEESDWDLQACQFHTYVIEHLIRLPGRSKAGN